MRPVTTACEQPSCRKSRQSPKPRRFPASPVRTSLPASFKRGRNSMIQLQVHGLKKHYGSRVVVKDVSLEVTSGEVVGLLGPNGAGKTTCFYMIVGLIAVDDGAIHLDGREISHFAMHRRA